MARAVTVRAVPVAAKPGGVVRQPRTESTRSLAGVNWAPALRLAAQALLLCALFEAGSVITGRLHIPLPGNLVGMLMLLGLLFSRAVTPSQLEGLTTPCLKHLAFLFIPYAVGLMTWSGLLRVSGIAILVSLVGSSAAGLVAAGWVAQLRLKGGRLP